MTSMCTSTARTSLSVFLAALAVLLVASCSGDDGDSGGSPVTSTEEQAFYEQLADALGSTEDAAAAFSQERADAFAPSMSEAEREAAGVELSESYVELSNARRDAIAALVPPDSLATLHEALVAAADENIALAEDVRDQITESPVTTGEEYDTVFFDADGPVITQRLRDACSDIQNRAAAGGSDVTVGCNF